jgi:hypothetical protein
MNPTFGYPVMMFHERFRSFGTDRPMMPERLNPRFRIGRKAPISHRTRQKKELNTMEDYINRKILAKVKDKLEEFFT